MSARASPDSMSDPTLPARRTGVKARPRPWYRRAHERGDRALPARERRPLPEGEDAAARLRAALPPDDRGRAGGRALDRDGGGTPGARGRDRRRSARVSGRLCRRDLPGATPARRSLPHRARRRLPLPHPDRGAAARGPALPGGEHRAPRGRLRSCGARARRGAARPDPRARAQPARALGPRARERDHARALPQHGRRGARQHARERARPRDAREAGPPRDPERAGALRAPRGAPRLPPRRARLPRRAGIGPRALRGSPHKSAKKREKDRKTPKNRDPARAAASVATPWRSGGRRVSSGSGSAWKYATIRLPNAGSPSVERGPVPAHPGVGGSRRSTGVGLAREAWNVLYSAPRRRARWGTTPGILAEPPRIETDELRHGALGRCSAPPRSGAVPPHPRGLDPPAGRRGGPGGAAPALSERLPSRSHRGALRQPDRALRRGGGGAQRRGGARRAPDRRPRRERARSGARGDAGAGRRGGVGRGALRARAAAASRDVAAGDAAELRDLRRRPLQR